MYQLFESIRQKILQVRICFDAMMHQARIRLGVMQHPWILNEELQLCGSNNGIFLSSEFIA